ncbi:hypothetical protein SANTM175S_03217 [Streptomyces antimycoticus]
MLGDAALGGGLDRALGAEGFAPAGGGATDRRAAVDAHALYGTDELADAMIEALRDRSGCLLRNHGTVVHGATLDQAFDRTAQLEWMCRVWLTAVSVPGRTPTLIPPDELRRAADKLSGYGQPG